MAGRIDAADPGLRVGISTRKHFPRASSFLRPSNKRFNVPPTLCARPFRFLMRRNVVFVFALLVGFGWGPLWANTIPSRQYLRHDGLPAKHITALAQTNNGLLWIGTTRGLVVYDGHEFRPIPMPDSVQNKAIFALEPMPNGTVWAGVGHDAVRVAPYGPVQSRLLDAHNVIEILRREDRLLFVTHLAVWKQKSGRKTLSRTPFRYETLTDVTQVWGADLGPEGDLWIVNARKGPGHVRPDGMIDFADPPTLPSVEYEQNTRFYDLRFSRDGTALVERGSYLYRFDPERETFSVIASPSTPLDEGIYRQGQTAYLVQGPAVLRYDTEARRFQEPIQVPQHLSRATTTTALRDREGGLWVGTNQSGLLHFPAPKVRHVRSIDGWTFETGLGLERGRGALWGTTWGDGLFQICPRRKRLMPGGHTRWVILRSHDSRLHGLTPSNSARGRDWYRWTPDDGWQFVAFARRAVRGYVDSSGIGYFWHNDGLYRHVPVADTTRRTRLHAWPVEESQHHLMGPAPNGDLILFDQGTVLRLRRPDGAAIDTIARVPEHASSGGRRLTIDAKGRIWAPFASLLRIDPRQGTTQTLLEGAMLEKVQMAGDSLATALTDEGLYLIGARSGAVRRHLSSPDGLLSNDVNGVHLADDTLYVGHPSGLTLVPTDALFRSPQSPPAVLTGLEVNLEDRALPADSVLGKDERAVGFSYTGASLTHPDRVRYEVRLAPRETAWSTTERRFTRYTNLEPGTYRFEVRARLEERAPGPAAVYTFTVPPFFYETWWFRLLVGLGLVGLGAGAWRWRTYRLRRQKEKLETAVEARTEELAEEKRKTERQAERLQELDEAKNRFFAHISHEFRTPLSLILGPLRSALQEIPNGTVSLDSRQLRHMTQNAERLQRLIEQLLDLATLEAGRMELELQPGDLAGFIRRVAEAFRSRAEEKNIHFQVDAPPERIETHFDPEKVETMLSNLVGNALKFTPEGGAVSVRVSAREDTGKVDSPQGEGPASGTARIEVEDTGPGIEPKRQEQIFERFAQVDEAGEQEGVGLGLTLTHELATLHGGTVEVRSTPGEGTVFTVLFPLMPVSSGEKTSLKEMPAPLDSEASAETVGDGERRERETAEKGPPDEEDPATVLVVEDNAEMRAYLREHLSEHWGVLEASDGTEGWEVAAEKEPDLVLRDVMMPGMDGFELCRRIKSEEALRTTPVILLTARAADEDTLEGLEAGADDYVDKPFKMEELRQRLENHLAARKHARSCYQEEVRLRSIGGTVEEEQLPFLREVTEAVEAHLSNPDFTTEWLADEVALSRRQLTRRLKETVGETPAAFIRECRIERAKELLGEGPKTVAEVAYAVGFRSPSHFSQVFQEEVGLTPTDYQDTEEV